MRASCRSSRLARCRGLLCAGGVVASSISAAPALADAAPTGGAASGGVVQEVSLDSLGIGAETVRGPAGSVSVWFPAPAAPLAGSGSFVRLSYGHSAEVSASSNLEVAVNGAAPASVTIGPGTASGSVIEIALPAGSLRARRPNLVQVRFRLAPAPGAPAGDGLFGRVDGRTLLHYQLVEPGDRSFDPLQAYPYSLLGTSADPSSQVGLVLPASPDPAEVAAALRVFADVGRRAWSRRVVPVAVTSGQERWLESAGFPALVVGRLDDLPAAGAVLRQAEAEAGTDQPGPSSALGPREGILVAPASGKRLVIALTGRTDEAVAAAAEALVDRAPAGLAGLAGPLEVVGQGAGPGPAPPRHLSLSSLVPGDEPVDGEGEHRLAFGVAVPSVDPSRAGLLHLAISASGASGGGPLTAGVEVGGRAIGGGALAAGADRTTRLDLELPGRALRPGVEGVVVDLVVPPAGAGAPPGAGPGARLLADESTLTLPPAPTSPVGPPGLEGLPYPFLDRSPGSAATVVLASTDRPGIEAAATTMVALGARSTAPPPALGARRVGERVDGGAPNGNLIVVGSFSLPLELRLGAGGSVAIPPPTRVARRAAGDSLGWIEMVDLPAPGGQVLWVGGVDVPSTVLAAQALSDRGLDGSGVVVRAGGGVSPAPINVPPVSRSIEVRTAEILAWVFLGLLLLGLGSCLRRLRPEAGRPGRAWYAVALVAWCAVVAGVIWRLAVPLAAHLFWPALAVVAMLPLLLPAPRRSAAWLTASVLAACYAGSQAAVSGQPAGVEPGGVLPATYLPGALLRPGLASWATAFLGAALLLATAGVAEVAWRRLRPAR